MGATARTGMLRHPFPICNTLPIGNSPRAAQLAFALPSQSRAHLPHYQHPKRRSVMLGSLENDGRVSCRTLVTATYREAA